VFCIKHKANGITERYKARHVENNILKHSEVEYNLDSKISINKFGLVITLVWLKNIFLQKDLKEKDTRRKEKFQLQIFLLILFIFLSFFFKIITRDH